MSTFQNPLLEAKGITKYFGTITALENVDLKVHAGECLGVVGDNGAGKSTLMKVLSGLYKPSSGSLYFQGKEEILESPKDSQNLGLEMVYQDLALAGNLPIGENIFLGREPTKNIGFLKFLDFNKIKELTNAHLGKLKINVKSADQKVEELSGGQRQAVAIARSTAFNAKVVIMDEPTDRSIPAVTMTMKTPKANIDCHEICLKTFVTFLHDKKTSGCRMCITSIISTSNKSMPYFSI